jgi:hypothetical protein
VEKNPAAGLKILDKELDFPSSGQAGIAVLLWRPGRQQRKAALPACPAVKLFNFVG